MYKCDKCGKSESPRTEMKRMVVEKRTAIYSARYKCHRKCPYLDDPKERYRDDPGGTGWEIVRELKLCAECFKNVK